MGAITIGQKSLELPILVPSVSSFETLLRPAPALQLQNALGEPISLVSAYDVANGGAELLEACLEYRQSGILLLDSGGYESSRILRYTKNPIWNFERFREVAAQHAYEFVFSYDYFIYDDESTQAFQTRLINEFKNYAHFLDLTKLIPVIHVVSFDGKRRLSDHEIVEVFRIVSEEMGPPFVAIPERELGSGILARAQLVKKIVRAIDRQADPCGLHVLGCGNPLSFSVLAVAGAAMCDGLEWCRTLAADNFHLHHFQQKDLFPDLEFRSHPLAARIADYDLPYSVAVAARNLLTLQTFSKRLHERIRTRTVHEMVQTHYGKLAAEALRAIEI